VCYIVLFVLFSVLGTGTFFPKRGHRAFSILHFNVAEKENCPQEKTSQSL